MTFLGYLLEVQGDIPGARFWYQRAADGGRTDAMYNLGVLLEEQGDVEGARAWLQRAASAGHSAAMEMRYGAS